MIERVFQRKFKRSSVDVGIVGIDGVIYLLDILKFLEIFSIKIEFMS